MNDFMWLAITSKQSRFIDKLKGEIRSWKSLIESHQREVAHLEKVKQIKNERIAILKAQKAAYMAVMAALQKTHPNSRFFEKVGYWRRGASAGKPKLAFHRLWAAFFDEQAEKLGIKHPEFKRSE